MKVEALAVAVLILYFVYMSWSSLVRVARPAGPVHAPPPRVPHHIQGTPSSFTFSINHTNVWTSHLPKDYAVHQDRLVVSDVCFGERDGAHVLAQGRVLYNYLQHEHHSVTFAAQAPFESNATSTSYAKDMFYFTCHNGRVHDLHMCPPGHFFQHDRCKSIDACFHQKTGTLLPDPYSLQHYFECDRRIAMRRVCPDRTYFVQDECRNRDDFMLYCQFHTEPKVLDANSMLVCDQGKPRLEWCPSDMRFFDDAPRCVSAACVQRPDGLHPLPEQRIGAFSFRPGYRVCKNGKVDQEVTCPTEWDPSSSVSGPLVQLPQVFDGQRCTAPDFCINVYSHDPDTIVTVHEFTKHVRNWRHSVALDRVTGYVCKPGGTRKRVAVEPGQRIDPKRFKREPACGFGDPPRLFVSDRPSQYYDCRSKRVQDCPSDTYFDGDTCVPRIPHAHAFRGVDLFTLSSLRADNWIEPWNYKSNKATPHCPAPEIYVERYDLCSHPDCVLYPFLSQIPLDLAIRDGAFCTFQASDQRLVKKSTPFHYSYWSQRRVDEPTLSEPCVPGQNVSSGHFVLDSTLFATCDDQQPFVFCPSSDTQGIEQVNGQKYACKPSSGMTRTFPTRTRIDFLNGEIQRLQPTHDPTFASVNGQRIEIPLAGYDVKGQSLKLETLEHPVHVDFLKLVTHPPDIVWEEDGGQVSRQGGSYLMRLQGFTFKSLGFPEYTSTRQVPDFTFERRI